VVGVNADVKETGGAGIYSRIQFLRQGRRRANERFCEAFLKEMRQPASGCPIVSYLMQQAYTLSDGLWK